MAITLPTFSIDDPVKEQRLLDAFKPTPSSTNAEAAAEYRAWLKKSLIAEVRRREDTHAIQAALAALSSVEDLLDPT